MERKLALLKIGSLIIDKRFIAYQAERDLRIGTHGGNHESRMEEINREIEALMADLEEKNIQASEDPYAVDWNQIPEGFNYVATDSDGEVYAFDIEPAICDNTQWGCNATKFHDLFIKLEHNPDWENSLRKRPVA